jgi:hypothetical protein
MKTTVEFFISEQKSVVLQNIFKLNHIPFLKYKN